MLKLCLLLGLCAFVWSAPRPRGSCPLQCGWNGVRCPEGYDCRSNGCGLQCMLKDDKLTHKDCPPLMCDHLCPFGVVRDHHGCRTCHCDNHMIELGR